MEFGLVALLRSSILLDRDDLAVACAPRAEDATEERRGELALIFEIGLQALAIEPPASRPHAHQKRVRHHERKIGEAKRKNRGDLSMRATMRGGAHNRHLARDWRCVRAAKRRRASANFGNGGFRAFRFSRANRIEDRI